VTDPTEHQTTTPDATPTSRELAYSRWSGGSSGFADFLRRARAESRLVHERAVRARRAKVRRRPSHRPRVAAASHTRRDAAIAVAVAAALAAFAAFISFGFFSPLPEVVGDDGAARADRDRTPQREPSPASVGTARPSSPGNANPTEALTSVSRAPRQVSSGPPRLPSGASVASAPAAPPAPPPPPESLPPEPTDSPPPAAAPEAAPPDVPASDPPAPAQQAPDPPDPDLPNPDPPAAPDFSAQTDPPAPPDD
jgi:hypothetical protein